MIAIFEFVEKEPVLTEKLSINSRGLNWGRNEMSEGNPSRPRDLLLFTDLMAFVSSSSVMGTSSDQTATGGSLGKRNRSKN